MPARIIRDFEPGDRDAVLNLRARVFEGLDPRREKVRWEWEFEANPWRRTDVPCSFLLEEDGRLVGHYGMLPLPVSLDGRRATALCGMDFCIEPEQQGAGLGLLLTRRFLDPALCDVALVTSPTPAATALMRYFGGQVWQGSQEPSLWVYSRAAGSPPPKPMLALEEPHSFDERFDQLFARVSRHYRLLTVRDSTYLNWRYRDYPFGTLVPCAVVEGGHGVRGLSVLQVDEALRRAYLPELLADPDDAECLDALLHQALGELYRRELDELYVLHREPAVQEALARAGFQVVESHPITFLCRLPESGPPLADWYLPSGDGDLLFSVGSLPS